MIKSFKISILFVFHFFVFFNKISAQDINVNSPWDIVQQVKDTIGEILFPDRQFNVMDFGAVSDGIFNNSEAIGKAIEACYSKGGGSVVIPDGKFFTGPIHLKNNVNLHLNAGAEILFSTDPQDFYPLVHTSFEGIELMNYSPLIYAYNCKNIAVTGEGVLNGQAGNSNWWPWCGGKSYNWQKGMPCQNDELNRPMLEKMAENGVPVKERVFGNGHFLRPSFIEPFGCKSVLIKGVKIINAPFWVIHPIKCTNVIVDGVTVQSHGPNNDGCDPEYSKNVLIMNSTFNTGDDCIAIKSGRDHEGRTVAIKSENIIIQGCNMVDGHGGIVIGSEVSAGVRNVFAENCTMSSPNLDRVVRIKTNSKRGGVIENVYVRNIEVGFVKETVLKLNMHYNVYGNQSGNYLPIIRNIRIENITVKEGGKYGIWAIGLKDSPIQDVEIKNLVIEKAENDYSVENIKDFKFINTRINGKLIVYP